ncbi:RHS repeat-associated core domain-containing protein, partial [Pseudomonas sp. B2M1-30]|uniref:RHS repeat-associated core domain-containing protein n=1 Tax=Pseudomonas TaxID=286 RepID=UPI0021C786BA
DAYGKIAALELAAHDYLDQPLRFQGQYFDAESGLHYNRHRYYDPDTGRYLTPDPVKLAGGLNQYRYVPNPTGWVDPLGLNANCPPPGKTGCAVPDTVDSSVTDRGEPAAPQPKNRPYNFGSEGKLIEHYEKHGAEFKALSKDDYLLIARDVVNLGTHVRYEYKEHQRSGFFMLMGNNKKGESKFAFVGTNDKQEITTLHTKSGKDFWRTINRDAKNKEVTSTHD